VAEIEIHGHPHPGDTFGQTVGVAVGIIGIFLAVVTIASHREHTAAVIIKTAANDQWAFYQAKRGREYQADVGVQLIGALGTDATRMQAATNKLQDDRDRYSREAADIKRDADQKELDASRSEARALRFDLGEGFLELGLVLSSLYFLSHKRLFPVFGVSAAVIGVVLAATGLWL
jgi:uncharacterized protein DUF4337